MRRSFQAVVCAGLLTAILLCGSAFADTTGFKITDYIPEKFKDFEWRVSGSANLRGEDTDNETYRLSPDYDRSIVEHRESAAQRLSLGTSFSYDYETVPQYLNFDLGFNAYLNASRSERSESSSLSSDPWNGRTEYGESESGTYQFNLRPRVDGGKYLIEDFFVSGIVSGSFSYRESPDNDSYSRTESHYFYDPIVRTRVRDYTSESSDDRRQYNIAVSLLPGWGRMYEGSYASTAMYMIEELRKNGILLREPTNDEMLKLCDLVYQNRLKHAVDRRLRRIETFDEILGYLADAGITDASGSRGFLYIQDVWDYFPHDRRQFGLRSRLGFSLNRNYSRSRSSTDSHVMELTEEFDPVSPTVPDTLYYIEADRYTYYSNESDARNLFLQGMVEYGYPLSRQWQLDINGTARYFLDCHVTSDYDRVSTERSETEQIVQTTSSRHLRRTDKSYQFSLSPSLAYIYSSRTRVDFDASYEYTNLKTKTRVCFDDGAPNTSYLEEKNHDLSFNSTLTYRISIPTSLSVTAGYEYDSPATYYYPEDSDFVVVSEGDNNSHRYVIGVSLSHYLY